MGRTPDRNPGVLIEDEEILLQANATPPTTAGAFNYDGSSFQFRDASGMFDPRSGGSGAEQTRVFHVQEYAGGQVIPGWPPDPVTFNGTPSPTHAATFSWNGSSELTILRPGNVTVIAAVTAVRTGGGGRENMRARLERQPDGGSWTSLWGSDAWVYIRSNAGGQYGTAVARTAFVAAADDKIRVTAYREEESLSLATVEDACNLIVQWSPI